MHETKAEPTILEVAADRRLVTLRIGEEIAIRRGVVRVAEFPRGHGARVVLEVIEQSEVALTLAR